MGYSWVKVLSLGYYIVELFGGCVIVRCRRRKGRRDWFWLLGVWGGVERWFSLVFIIYWFFLVLIWWECSVLYRILWEC